MKYLKIGFLWLLLLAVMCLCGVAVIWLMNLTPLAQVDSVVPTGLDAGFVGWLMLLVLRLYGKKRGAR